MVGYYIFHRDWTNLNFYNNLLEKAVKEAFMGRVVDRWEEVWLYLKSLL